MTDRSAARASVPSLSVLRALQAADPPTDDGWGWLYRAFDRIAGRGSSLRRAVCRYFWPGALESAGDGRLYRLLGVGHFGQVIPTGGIAIRRATGARMAPYTLSGTSIRAARDFYFRACVFEACHLPFFLTLLALSLQRLWIGWIDIAVQETLLNLAVNVYPIMHHRNSRLRIVRLLSRRAGRSGQSFDQR